jgi:hypothetical protein
VVWATRAFGELSTPLRPGGRLSPLSPFPAVLAASDHLWGVGAREAPTSVDTRHRVTASLGRNRAVRTGWCRAPGPGVRARRYSGFWSDLQFWPRCRAVLQTCSRALLGSCRLPFGFVSAPSRSPQVGRWPSKHPVPDRVARPALRCERQRPALDDSASQASACVASRARWRRGC